MHTNIFKSIIFTSHMSYYIIIRGPLGCGKSTIAESISQRINAQHFSVDKILAEHNLEHDKEEGYISQKSFKKVNEIISPDAEKILEGGKPVIFDGNFYWKSQIEDLISRLHFPHYVFTLKAPLEVCIERDKSRNNTHGEAAARVVFNKSTEFDYGEVIDVTNPLHETTEEILSYVLS